MKRIQILYLVQPFEMTNAQAELMQADEQIKTYVRMKARLVVSEIASYRESHYRTVIHMKQGDCYETTLSVQDIDKLIDEA